MNLSVDGRSYHISKDTIDQLPQEAWSSVIRTWFDEDVARISTSGSTGPPKPIELSGSLIRWSAHSTQKALGLHHEHVLICIPVDKTGGLMLLLRSVIFDWNCTLIPPVADPMEQIDKNHSFSLISLVPYQVANILKRPESAAKLKRFKTLLIGGGILPKIVENQLLAEIIPHVSVYHTYGMTETASHIALRQIRKNSKEWFSLLPGVSATCNASGLLHIDIPETGIHVETNDLVELKENAIRFRSRADEVVNSGGVKLSIPEIETKIASYLEKMDINCRFFLWKTPDDQLGEKLVFVGIESSDQPAVQKALDDMVLPGYEKPKQFYWAKDFLRTPTGKIKREETLQSVL